MLPDHSPEVLESLGQGSCVTKDTILYVFELLNSSGFVLPAFISKLAVCHCLLTLSGDVGIASLVPVHEASVDVV